MRTGSLVLYANRTPLYRRSTIIWSVTAFLPRSAHGDDDIALLDDAIHGVGELRIGRLVAHAQGGAALDQFDHLRPLDARRIPGQGQRPAGQQQLLPLCKGHAQPRRQLAEVLDAVGQIADNGVEAWTARYLAHMQPGLARVAVRQGEIAPVVFRANLELIAPPGPASPLVQLFM